MSLWSGTPDKAIYADTDKAIAGMGSAVKNEYRGSINTAFNSALGSLAGQQQFAFQGKTPLAAAGKLTGILDGIFGQQLKMQNAKYIKEGSPGLLSGMLSAAGDMFSAFGTGGGSGSKASGAGLMGNDLTSRKPPTGYRTGPNLSESY